MAKVVCHVLSFRKGGRCNCGFRRIQGRLSLVSWVQGRGLESATDSEMAVMECMQSLSSEASKPQNLPGDGRIAAKVGEQGRGLALPTGMIV